MAGTPEFRIINGVRTPLTPRKGKGGVVVLAIGLAVALGASGAVGLGGASSSADAAGAKGAKSAKGGSRVGEQDSLKAVARLERLGFRITAHLDAHDGDCAAHAYGTVQQFFREHPCDGLQRALFEVRDKQGDVVLVAVAWVELPDAGRAAELKRLLDRHGTGNLTELSREQGRYRAVRFTGDFYASDRNDAVVVNGQAQPVARGPAGLVLTAIVTNAVR